MNGLTVMVDPSSQRLPKSYKYTAMSTQFYVEYKNGGWTLVGVVREPLNQKRTFTVMQMPHQLELETLNYFKSW